LKFENEYDICQKDQFLLDDLITILYVIYEAAPPISGAAFIQSMRPTYKGLN